MSYVCVVCGQEHDGLPALAFHRPDHWLALSAEQQAQGKCDNDLCMTPDGNFFVRGVLEIPIVDGPEPNIEFGVWTTLSEASFGQYVTSFSDLDQSKLGTLFGWFANEMRNEFAGSTNLKCNVRPQDNRQRPLIEIQQPSDHPLAIAQRDGITFEHAQRLVHQHGAA